MANLTETARITRQGIVAVGILIVLIFVGTIVWRLSPVSQPEQIVIPTPAPESRFGLLPPLVLPENESYPSNLKLETIAGGPPVSTSSAYIYFVPEKLPNLFSRRNAESMARLLGFNEDPRNLNENTMSFSNSSQDTFVVDITTKNFTLKRSIANLDKSENENTQQLFQSVMPTEPELVRIAQEFFITHVDWDQNLTKTNVSYYIKSDSTLSKAPLPSNAEYARVDFFTNQIGDYPVLTKNREMSDNYVTFSTRGNRINTIAEASYQQFPYDQFNPSTYPTISGQQAWELMLTGQGYITRPAGATVTVRDGYMAYFLNSGYHPFIQPVYVFTGDNNFMGIVPAIDPLWIGK